MRFVWSHYQCTGIQLDYLCQTNPDFDHNPHSSCQRVIRVWTFYCFQENRTQFLSNIQMSAKDILFELPYSTTAVSSTNNHFMMIKKSVFSLADSRVEKFQIMLNRRILCEKFLFLMFKKIKQKLYNHWILKQKLCTQKG